MYEYASRAERGVPLQKVNLRERARFQDGEKLIAILSDAGATGVSLHADQTQSNQRRRYHIVPELGWSASKIVQQFGRSHRTNQLMPPECAFLPPPLTTWLAAHLPPLVPPPPPDPWRHLHHPTLGATCQVRPSHL